MILSFPAPPGILSMHWLADHLLLWQSPVTHAALLSAHSYYFHTLIRMDAVFSTVLHACWLLGGVFVVAKIALGRRESNWLFDGASLCGYQGAVV